jgi:hypothetical protein
VFVEGNADLTPAKLIGHHNPARVLREDYSAANFVDGPLLEAMREGGFLYIEEFNRAPEDTLNTLLTAMAEREVAVPRVGRIAARPTFRVIATMNPFHNVGTTRLSTSVHDRLCRLAMTYQDAEAERGIVTLRAPLPPGEVPAGLAAALVADAVAVTRARTCARAAACGARSTSRWWQGSCWACGASATPAIPAVMADCNPATRPGRPTRTPSLTPWWWPCPGGFSWTRPRRSRPRGCFGRRARQIAGRDPGPGRAGTAAVGLRAQRRARSPAGGGRAARLDVLLDASGEHDADLARDLARLGRGRLARTRGYRDVAPAVSGLFAR